MINTGDVVISTSGHDRGEYYLVIASDETFAYLADGRLKLMSKPKKKNVKHISRIGRCDELIDMIKSEEKITDVKLKYLLKQWRNRCLNQTL